MAGDKTIELAAEFFETGTTGQPVRGRVTREALAQMPWVTDLTAEEPAALEKVSHRGHPSKIYLAFLLFALLSGLYLLPFMRVLLPWSNEGTLASGAVRVLNGEVFGRDVFEVMGPGTFYLLAGVFKLLGPTFFAMRVYVFLVSWGTGLALCGLTMCLRSQRRVLPALMVAATCYGMQWPGASHHLDGIFFALTAVVCIAMWYRRREAWLLVSAGLFAGVTACIHQPKGLLVTTAMLFWLLARERTSGRSRRMASLQLLTGVAAVSMAACAYFWSHHALGDVFYANVVWPAQHYGTVNQVSYGLGIFHEYWRGWAFQKGWLNWPAAMASILVVPFLYVATLPLIMVLLLLSKGWSALGELGQLYLFCGIALWVSEAHRHDIYHLAFGSPLLVIVSLHLLGGMRGRGIGIAVQSLALTAACLAGVNLLSAATAQGVPTRVGDVGLYRDSGLIAALDSQVKPGEKIFIYPYRPIYYFLSKTVNPTRFLTLTYNYNTEAEFDEAIRCLEESRVRTVVWDRKFQAEVAPTVFAPAAMNPPGGFVMENYFRSRYRVVKEIDGVFLMERNDESGSH